MLDVVIDRKRWGQEQLRCEDGKMCCMGFAGRAAGYAASTLAHNGMIHDVLNNGRKLKKGLEKLVKYVNKWEQWDATPVAVKLAYINDGILEPKKKEADIIKYGKKAGIKF